MGGGDVCRAFAPVNSPDHKQLLELLRALHERIELARALSRNEELGSAACGSDSAWSKRVQQARGRNCSVG